MVYVDKPIYSFRDMTMGHMITDTEEELHVFAIELGLKRDWFQENSSFPHYDISTSKFKLALKNGAKLLTSKDLVKKAIEIKNKRWITWEQ